MANIPLPAAATAGGSSVTVEDESATLKRCSGCCSDRPESDFSGAQLKKKGKRVCRGCVEQREWAEAKAANDAAAAKFAARPPLRRLQQHLLSSRLSVRCRRLRRLRQGRSEIARLQSLLHYLLRRGLSEAERLLSARLSAVCRR